MVLRNGKVYISHTAEDTELFAPLVAQLDEKQVDYWTSSALEGNALQLSPHTVDEIAHCDVFLRICTPAATESAQMQREAAAFRATQVQDTLHGTPNQHIVVDLVMDPAYRSSPTDAGYLTINATTQPMTDWLVVLYNEMGQLHATRDLNRRTALVIAVIVVIVLLVLTVLIFAFLLKGV